MSEEDDDYMSDAILAKCSDTRPGLVSSKTARKHHLEKKNKESNAKNLVKPKAQIEHEKREEGLQAAISSSNKGFALLAKMGYKPGMGIGKTGEGRKEPVGISVKTDRGGLGAEADRKRRNEQWTAMRSARHIKRQKMETKLKQDFQQRMRNKFSDGKAERDLIRSQKVCEQLDSEMGTTEPEEKYFWPKSLITSSNCPSERLDSGISYEVVDEDDNDNEEEEDLLTNEEKLESLTAYLRTIHLYCIWCGTKYEDENDMNTNCPGDNADAHDE